MCGSESGESVHSDDITKGSPSSRKKERFGVSRTAAISDFGAMSEADEDDLVNEIVRNAGNMNIDCQQSIAEEPAESPETELPVSDHIVSSDHTS